MSILISLYKNFSQYPWLKPHIDECCITYSSILIVLDKFEEAKQVLDIGIAISSHFNMDSLQGKLQLMKLSIDIHEQSNKNENVCNQEMFKHIHKLFRKDGNSGGIRAMKCLQGVCKFKLWEHIRNKELQDHMRFHKFQLNIYQNEELIIDILENKDDG